MFDINLLENPGILQDKKSMPEVRVTNSQRISTSIDLSIDSELNKTRRRNTKNYLLILISIGLLLLIMGSILNHNKINQADALESVEIPVKNFFNVTNVFGSPDVGFVSGDVEAFKTVNLYDTATSARGTEVSTVGTTVPQIGRAKSRGFETVSTTETNDINATSSSYKQCLFDVEI